MGGTPSGFLIALPLAEIQDMDYKELPGLVFVFESNQAVHYKNQRMFEMDGSYGIAAHEVINQSWSSLNTV